MATINLAEVEKAEITILVDNYSDLFLTDTDIVKRFKVTPPNAIKAEPGLSCLVTVYSGDQKHTILMDAGISGECFTHNAALFKESLGVVFGMVQHKVEDTEAVVLSHGHFDHFGGMSELLKHFSDPMPLIVHPEAFAPRRAKLAPEMYVDMPPVSVEMLTDAGATVETCGDTTTIADNHILVTGSIKRRVDFETGAPNLEAQLNGEWAPDGFLDDQAIAFRLKDKGLVVLSGCAHAGIINTTLDIKDTTGIDQVYAVMGGFHLNSVPSDVITKTVDAMKDISPEIVVPMHCTGWDAIHHFSKEMPDQFILNSAGTTYVL